MFEPSPVTNVNDLMPITMVPKVGYLLKIRSNVDLALSSQMHLMHLSPDIIPLYDYKQMPTTVFLSDSSRHEQHLMPSNEGKGPRSPK